MGLGSNANYQQVLVSIYCSRAVWVLACLNVPFGAYGQRWLETHQGTNRKAKKKVLRRQGSTYSSICLRILVKTRKETQEANRVGGCLLMKQEHLAVATSRHVQGRSCPLLTFLAISLVSCHTGSGIGIGGVAS